MKINYRASYWLSTGLIATLTTAGLAQDIRVGGPLRPGHARPPLHVNARPSAATYYAPAQIRRAYGVDQLLANGTDGSRQTIAIVDAYGNTDIQNDLNTFCSKFGLTQTTVQITGTTGNNTGWALETALDVEWAHAIAPGATILLSVAKSSSNGDLLAAVDAAVSAGATVVSMSWGGSEFANEAGYDSHFNVPGVTFIASSGDSGESTSVEWPAVSPYVVGVGGTSLYLDASGNRTSPEAAWSGSGGGLSSVYGQPSWQSGWFQNGWPAQRGVPDVSYVADPNTGLLVYDSVNGGWFVVGGTSAGAPQWAALIALANQQRSAAGTLTSANATLYSLAQVAATPYAINSAYFYDIASGANGNDPDDISGPGYDLVTGVGSPVANSLVSALGPQTPDFSVSVAPGSQTVASEVQATYTVTVTSVGGFSGTVSLAASSSATVGGLPASVTVSPGNPASVAITASSSVTGSSAITVTGTSGSLKHTAIATLVVGTPDFSISASPTSRTVRHGSSTYYTVAVTPSGGFNSAVTFGVSGLPSGATTSFSPTSVTGSGNTRMTVKTRSNTPRGSYTLTVTGTGGSLTHSTTVSLTVN